MILLSLELLDGLAKPPRGPRWPAHGTRCVLAPGPDSCTPASSVLRGRAGLRPCPWSPDLGGKATLWFRAGQREAVMGSHSCHCLGVPGCPGTSWVPQCSWFWDPEGMGALKATAVKEQVNPMPLKRPGVLFGCPEPPPWLFLMISHLCGPGTVLRHLRPEATNH